MSDKYSKKLYIIRRIRLDGTHVTYRVGSVIEWLQHRGCDRHGLGSKPTRAFLLCPWERHFTALSLFGSLGKQF